MRTSLEELKSVFKIQLLNPELVIDSSQIIGHFTSNSPEEGPIGIICSSG
jgi:arginine exporter protein ArgO